MSPLPLFEIALSKKMIGIKVTEIRAGCLMVALNLTFKFTFKVI